MRKPPRSLAHQQTVHDDWKKLAPTPWAKTSRAAPTGEPTVPCTISWTAHGGVNSSERYKHPEGPQERSNQLLGWGKLSGTQGCEPEPATCLDVSRLDHHLVNPALAHLSNDRRLCGSFSKSASPKPCRLRRLRYGRSKNGHIQTWSWLTCASTTRVAEFGMKSSSSVVCDRPRPHEPSSHPRLLRRNHPPAIRLFPSLSMEGNRANNNA